MAISDEKIAKLRDRVSRSAEKCQRLQENLNKERTALKKFQDELKHLEFNDLIETLSENEISPQEALRVLQKEMIQGSAENQSQSGGEGQHEETL